MEEVKNIPIGNKAKALRRNRIAELINVIKGNKGWRIAFVEKYPHFDNAEASLILDRASRGIADDIELIEPLEEFIPFVVETQPSWYVKQKPITIELKPYTAKSNG